MKIVIYIGCLIAAALVWFIGGLIAWNIVCSFVDAENTPILMLANYRIATYSGISILSSYCVLKIKFDDRKFDFTSIATIYVVAAIIACVVNYWESVWDSVALIITILYNVVNILLMSVAFYAKD